MKLQSDNKYVAVFRQEGRTGPEGSRYATALVVPVNKTTKRFLSSNLDADGYLHLSDLSLSFRSFVSRRAFDRSNVRYVWGAREQITWADWTEQYDGGTRVPCIYWIDDRRAARLIHERR